MAELALVGVTLLWGASFTVAKETLALVPPFALVCVRFAIGFGVLLALRPTLLAAGAATLRVGLGLGAVLWIAFALQTVGLAHTTPAKSAFLTGCAVLLVPPLEWLILGRRVPNAVIAGALIAMVGLFLLLHPSSLSDVNRGDLLTFACAFGFALHIVLLGRYALGHSSRALAAYQILAVAMLAAPPALWAEGQGLSVPAAAWPALIFLGVACTAIAVQVQTWAQQRTAPTRAALIFALEPVSAALISVFWSGEQLAAGEWLGGALVVAGVLTGSLGRAEQAGTVLTN